MHTNWYPVQTCNLSQVGTDLRLKAVSLSSWDMILGTHTQQQIVLNLHVSVLSVLGLFGHCSDAYRRSM